MRREEFEEQFLDYLEDKLTPKAKDEFEEALATDVELKKSFNAYQHIVKLESVAQNQSFTPVLNISDQVLQKVSRSRFGFIKEYLMEIANLNRRWIFAATATCATVLLAVKLVQVDGRITQPISPMLIEQEEHNAKSPSGIVIAKPEGDTKSDQVVFPPEQFLAEANVGFPGEKSKAIEMTNPMHNSIAGAQKQSFKDAIGASVGVSALAPLGVTTPEYPDFRVSEHVYKPDVDTTFHRYFEPPFPAPSVVSAERYKEYGENPRVSVLAEPFSTFSIDVDTGSYTNVRRFLTMGQLPPKEAVRIEEFINYFKYDYPVQFEQPFTLSYEIAPAPLEGDRYLLKLGIKAKDTRVNNEPWNLVFLVDVSGSMMQENKLPLVKRALHLLADQMRAEDRISIVTYAGEAGVVLPSIIGTNTNKSIIHSRIESLNAGGSTNGAGGIEMAYSIAQQFYKAGNVNRVVLATDGDFNVGLSSFDDLMRLIEEKRQTGITLTTLGFGDGNLKEDNMEQLANRGNGNYFFIDSFNEARKVLATDFLANMEVVAKDVKLQLEFNPAHVSQYRLIGYENRKIRNEDFNNDQIDAGEIGTGHTVTALYEVILAGTQIAQPQTPASRYNNGVGVAPIIPSEALKVDPKFASELGFLKIRYKDPAANNSKLLEFQIKQTHMLDSVSEASTDFKFAAAVSYFGHILRQSQYRGSYSISDVIKLAEANIGKDENGYRREFVGLMQNVKALEIR